MDNLNRYISDSDCYHNARTFSQAPKPKGHSLWRLGHTHCPVQKLTFITDEGEALIRGDEQPLSWLRASGMLPTHPDTPGRAGLVTLHSQTGDPPSLKKTEHSIWVTLTFRYLCVRYFSVNGQNKPMCERDLGKIMGSVPILTDHTTNSL